MSARASRGRWLRAVDALAIVGLLSVLGLAACAPYGAALKRRAAFDFDCPEAQVEVIELSDGVRGVKGCGKRATYVLTCAGPCSWVMNSNVEQSATPAPAATPTQTPPPAPVESTEPVQPIGGLGVSSP